ncbi:hypothetical protein MMC25_008003 [Agyrium rufum]|nr:hypothetical protein [Agyrium rufum]
MLVPQNSPTLHLSIKPNFSLLTSSFKSLSLTLTLPILPHHPPSPSHPLLTLATRLANIPSQDYESSPSCALEATDAVGSLSLFTTFDTLANIRRWFPTRVVKGSSVSVHFTAIPREIHAGTPIGPRTDLRVDAVTGGLTWMGMSAIPLPPGAYDRKQTDTLSTIRAEENRMMGTSESQIDVVSFFRRIIEWDLTASPPGTRAACTWGEAPASVERIGIVETFMKTAFAVGPLKRYPPWSEDEDTSNEAGINPCPDPLSTYFGIYYFPPLPPPLSPTLSSNAQIFQLFSTAFHDLPSPSNPYRIFMRRASPARGFGGTEGMRTYAFEYDDMIDTIDAESIFYLFAHEIAHNWPMMDWPAPGDKEVEPTNWYPEGMRTRSTIGSEAKGLASLLDLVENSVQRPLRTDRWRPKADINLGVLQARRILHLSNCEAFALAWENAPAGVLPYSRGFTYILMVDCQIRQANPDLKNVGIDGVVQDLIERRRKGLPVTEREWIDEVARAMGGRGRDVVERNVRRQWVRMVLEECEQELLEFGFDESSLEGARILKGLKEGSRAEAAGLREGDKLVRWTFLWQLMDDYDKDMRIVVEREYCGVEQGKMVEKEFVYRPRTWEKVESWRFVDISGESPNMIM